MNFKSYSLLMIIFIILIAIFFSSGLSNSFDDFSDKGISSDYNDRWLSKDMNVSRNNEYTSLSSNITSQYISKKIMDRGCTIEWDAHGTPNNLDYCIISDDKGNHSNVFNFINDLGVSGDAHIKLVISKNEIAPFVNDNPKQPVKLNANINDGLTFRFQINTGGSNINYSNFIIHS